MSTAPQYLTILDFSQGQNNAFDPRIIAPNTKEEVSSEAVLIENYDITERGALVTASGYELVKSLGTGEPIRHVCQYTYDPTYRYLLVGTKNKMYHLRKATLLTVHDCDTYNSGTYGTFVGTNGMGSVSTNTTTHQRGSGCVSGTITATSTNATLTVDPLTSVDLSSYTYVELFVYLATIRNVLNNADVFTSVEVRIGSSSSDYYTRTFTSPAVGSWASSRWHGLQFTLSGATSVGSPNLAAIDYIQIIFNAGATYAGGEVRIDHIIASKTGTDYQVVDLTGPRWAATASTDTYLSSVDFKGLNSLQYRIIANSDQSGLKVRHVGPGMLISEEVSSIVRTHILTEMNGFLLWANDRTISYSNSEDETTTGGVIGFPSRIMGLAPTTNDIVLVGTQDRMTYSLGFSFDDTTLVYTPIKKPYRAGVGCMSHNTIKPVYNDSIFWGHDGVSYYGQYGSEAGSGDYNVDSLSWKIDPKILLTNMDAAQYANGYYFHDRKEYGLAVPVGSAQTFSNKLFVYKKQYNAWIERSGISIGSAAEYREGQKNELFFGSSTTDSVYKMNNYYDYAGSNYTRRYISKIFHMGVPSAFKKIQWIEIAGSMPRGCEFYLIVHIDGETRTFKIDDECLLLNYIDTSGFYGDENYGDQYYGGDDTGLSFTPYRFISRISQPRTIWEGRELQFEFYNNTTGMPHKIDFVRIKYTIDPEDKLADQHHNSEIVANFEL